MVGNVRRHEAVLALYARQAAMTLRPISARETIPSGVTAGMTPSLSIMATSVRTVNAPRLKPNMWMRAPGSQFQQMNSYSNLTFEGTPIPVAPSNTAHGLNPEVPTPFT